MSHNYLFDTYGYLQQRLNEIHHRLTSSQGDPHHKQYTAGRIEALCELERFLMEHYDQKLPRRLRKHHKPSNVCMPKDP
jgi:hypothetical protein